MESKEELKEIDIKNSMLFFDGMMRVWGIDIDFNFSGILLGEKSYEGKIIN